MLTHDDFTEIKRELDDRYVLQSDCDSTQKDVGKKFANDDKRIDKLVDKFDTLERLLWVIATAGIGALVLEFFGLIFK